MRQADAAPSFVRIARARDVAPGRSRGYRVGRYEIAVFNIDGELHALENSCPHQGGPLADGWLEGPYITCPWHGWCFDVRSGKMTLGEFARVPRFELRILGEDLYVATEPLDDA
jgi:nitrite reductase/ring-hydroxylating ferredoxin subunit